MTGGLINKQEEEDDDDDEKRKNAGMDRLQSQLEEVWRALKDEVEGLLDPRLSFMVLVGEYAEELPEEPRVVDSQQDPGHIHVTPECT